MVNRNENDTLLKIKVIPNASKEQVVGWVGDVLKIKLQAPAQDGKANKALIGFLATKFKINRKNIILEQGETSANKLIRIVGMGLEDMEMLL